MQTQCKGDRLSTPGVLQHRAVTPQGCTLHPPSCALCQAVDQLHGTFPRWIYVHSLGSLKIYSRKAFHLLFLRGDFLTCVLPVFYLLPKMTLYTLHILLAFTWKCTGTFYFLGKKNPQYSLSLLIMFSVPDCLYTWCTMMANNYGLLWSSITTAFFLPKDKKKKKTDKWFCCLFKHVVWKTKHTEWSLRQLLKTSF